MDRRLGASPTSLGVWVRTLVWSTSANVCHMSYFPAIIASWPPIVCSSVGRSIVLISHVSIILVKLCSTILWLVVLFRLKKRILT